MSRILARLAIVALLAPAGCSHPGSSDELKPSPFYESLAGPKLLEEAFAGLTIAPGGGNWGFQIMNSLTGGNQKREEFSTYCCTHEQAVEAMEKLHESVRRLLTENKADVSGDASIDRTAELPGFKVHYAWGNSTGDVVATLTKPEDQMSAKPAEKKAVYRVTLVVSETIRKPGT
jgi:hypothetical protein